MVRPGKGISTRRAHGAAVADTLRELGYDKIISQTVGSIPMPRIAWPISPISLEQAACKVLNATDVANPLSIVLNRCASAQQSLGSCLFERHGRRRLQASGCETRDFLKSGLPGNTAGMRAQLMEIMMAQDFQDLTGQVIRKWSPDAGNGDPVDECADRGHSRRAPDRESVSSLLNGPVVKADGRADGGGGPAAGRRPARQSGFLENKDERFCRDGRPAAGFPAGGERLAVRRR